ncbi:hypothetical protein LPJ81_003335, partial [Coemansia sp. IMI 209127]
STEPAWQDVGANVLRMDTLYDATFHRWLKSEENVLTIAIHLQRISNEYPLDRIINALRWLVSSWRVESTAVIVRYVTADWAAPQNPPQPSTSPFRSDISRHASLLSDPGVLSGESRRGVLVRELTKDWTSQQIAQLVSILAVNLWCERPHLEAFIRTLVSDWDFCRLSSFFSYISNQLCLDYRVKVTMLQQAARRNASKLSLKRARNAAKPISVVGVSASKSKCDADAENDGNNSDNDTDSNKRLRTDAPTVAVDSVIVTEEPSSLSGTGNDSVQALLATNEQLSPSCGEPESAMIPDAITAYPAVTNIVSRAAAAATTASPSPSASSSSSSSSSSSTAEHIPSPAAASLSSSSHFFTNVSSHNATHPANQSDSETYISDNGGALVSLSVRAAQAGRMPAPLVQVPAMSRASSVVATTTPSTPVVASLSLQSQPTAPLSAAGCHSSEQQQQQQQQLQTSVSTTDLTSIPYNTHGSVQGSRQLQHHHLGRVAAAGSASTGRRTRSRNNTGSAVTNASVSLVVAASCSNRSSSLLVRRPLTPQTGSSLFSVHADGYRHQSPDSPTLHLDHRYSRRYPQPLTPSRSSTTLSIDNGIVSGGTSSSTEDADVASTSAGSSNGHLTSIARQSLRHHAASVSVSTAESQVLMPSSGHSNVSQQQQQPETEQKQQQQQQQDFRGRTSSESELGQFDGPASTHLSSLPLPPGSSATNTANVCGGRSSTAAHYDVLGIVIESEQHHFTESSV